MVITGAGGSGLVVGTTKNCILVGEMGGELSPIIVCVDWSWCSTKRHQNFYIFYATKLDYILQTTMRP